MRESALVAGGRFSIQRRLGQGGFGTVYQAYDRKRDEQVAIKMLHRVDPSALLRFKQEFRALADVRNPNLVRLGELIAHGDEWFFTMELIDGSDLLTWVFGGEPPPTGTEPAGAMVTSPPPDRETSPVDVTLAGILASEPTRRRFDEGRLRDGFSQLAEAVSALHALGMVHRDLKPSNVLVSRTGRLVVLDFGLIAHLGAASAYESLNIVGTPAYMSPEQGDAATVTTASDWYSVGVMLFEALTGRLPFRGPTQQVMLERRSSDAPRPRQLAPDVPADLDELCDELLRRNPAARPPGDEILRRLRRTAAPPPAPARPGAPFVGREGELGRLRESLAEVAKGSAATVFVSGRSGMGKSALAAHFLAEVGENDRNALVFTARCYERESVPYKALDGVVDGIGRYLGRLGSAEAGRFLPRDWLALTRLFPVLSEVGVATAGRRALVEISDPVELRRRGFAALRELLARLADHRTVVIFIDDLQWGDRDSGLLLRELIRPPDAPSLLLLACYRVEDTERSAILRLLGEDPDLGPGVRRFEVGALSRAEARELALKLLGGDDAGRTALADQIAGESGGSPFFVDELAHPGGAERGPAASPVALETAIQERLATLPAEPRRLLRAVAVAGRPVDLRVANLAAWLDPKDSATVETLLAGRWIRKCALEDREAFETFHDRIRETVVASLSEPELAACHRHLAFAWESAPTADAETLAEHYLNAGADEIAGRYALRAAEQAAAALAFDRAARLYQMSLEVWKGDPHGRSSLRAKLAAALANAGRGAEAGRAYLAAAEGDRDGALELRRRAAEQFLIGGHIGEGLQALESVLGTVGMRLARSPQRALAGLLVRRLQLALRGLRFRERSADQAPPELLTRTDVCWSVGIGLGMVEVVRSAHFQARCLLLALESGEPSRVARALLMEMGFSSTGGGRTRRRTAALRERCRALVEGRGDAYLHGLLAVQEGISASMAGEFPDSLAACRRGEAILRERCTGVTWELDTAHLYQLHALANTGAWRELAGRVGPLRADAGERGDLYLATYILSRNAYLVHLAAGDAVGAEEEQERSLDGWRQRSFQVQHYWDWFARGEIDLYAGRPERAWQRLAAQWSAFRRSLLPRVQAVKIEALYLRARTALALAAGSGPREARALIAAAERDARALAAERMPWGDGQAALARAGVAVARGDRERACALAAAAETGLSGVGMAHLAAAARWRRGTLVAGEEGGTLVADARERLARLGATDPERMVGMLAPGRWE